MGDVELVFNGVERWQKRDERPDFSENWGGWGNKKAAEKRPARY